MRAVLRAAAIEATGFSFSLRFEVNCAPDIHPQGHQKSAE